MLCLTSARLRIDEAAARLARRPESAIALSLSGPGGLSIIRLKQEKCSET